MEDKINVINKGLNNDSSYLNQPEGTYPFALNAVTESNEGDFQTLSNENSNEIFAQIKPNYVLIGSVYIGDEETCLFSVKNDNSESEIGILSDKKNKYEVWCNDSSSDKKNKLNFKVDKQIQATFKLRRGCEKLVYWTDNFNVPRQVNLNDKNFFINEDNTLKILNFNIIKDVNTVFEIDSIKLRENSGFFRPGSIKFLVRYLDKNKVPTRFIYESKNILLFKDSIENKYLEVDGDLYNKDTKAFKDVVVSKSLEIKFKNLDENYAFYQIAYIMYNDSIGEPSEAYISDLYPIIQKTVVYNGTNHKEKITLEEIKLSKQSFNIEKAKTITQKDDRLILANTKSKNLNFKDLQKYASRIKSDCIIKKVPLTTLDKHNPKNPLSLINGTGFKFGEIYSFGIVYVFEDGTESPVFHIPGRLPGDNVLDTEYDNSNRDLFPMSSDNEAENITYINRESCNNFNYWGKDYLGNSLDDNTKVRFHRFPSRADLKIPLFEDNGTSIRKKKVLKIKVLRGGFDRYDCADAGDKRFNCIKNGSDYLPTPLKVTLKYKINGEERVIEKNVSESSVGSIIFKESFSGSSDTIEMFSDIIIEAFKGSYKKIVTTTTTTTEQGSSTSSTTTYEKLQDFGVDFKQDNTPILTENFIERQYGDTEIKTSGNVTTEETTYKIYYREVIRGYSGGALSSNYYDMEEPTPLPFFWTKEYKAVSEENEIDGLIPLLKIEALLDIDYIEEENKETTIGGIHFSNVELPEESLLGMKCVGYYIVKQKIKESDKTVIDNVVLLPALKKGDYITNSLYNFYNIKNKAIRRTDKPEISKKDFVVLGMKNKFTDYDYSNADTLEINGFYRCSNNSVGGFYIHNVTDGKEDNLPEETGYTVDEDGVDLKNIIKDLKVSYENFTGNKRIIIDNKNAEYYNLNPYSFVNKEESSNIIANADILNKAIILSLKDSDDSDINNEISELSHNHTKFYTGIYKKNHKTYYEDYRTSPYERLNSSISNSKTFQTFCGDSIIGGYRHTTSAFLGTTPRNHAKKGDVLGPIKIALGAALILAGVFTGGATAIIGGLLIGGSSIIMGVKGIISLNEFNTMVDKHLNLGILDCFIDDLYYASFIENVDDDGLSPDVNPLLQGDNIIKYYSQVVGDFIFETDINFQLRVKSDIQTLDFMHPFSPRMSENTLKNVKVKVYDAKHDGHRGMDRNTINNIIYKTGSGTTFGAYFQARYVGVPIDNIYYRYFLNKVCKVNPERKAQYSEEIAGYEYRGIPDTILYVFNRDYSVFEDLLSYYMIPFEYSFCSDCEETFPQRFIWSEKDYQENLSDNYTNFLPNNYKDVSGKYGDITNIFTFNNNLYIHTEEGLWLQPTNPQQQMLNDVTIYIGTGEFGSLPPQLIIDDSNGTSAGLQHREAQILTPYGYFFVSEREKKIYKFDGKLTPISDIGMSKWFNNNIHIELDRQYRVINDKEYPYKDNPSNNLGTGFILTYDRERERILVTKKDYTPNQEIIKQGSDLCFDGNNYNLLEVDKIKSILESQGNQDLKNEVLSTATKTVDVEGNIYNYTPKSSDVYNYVGIENCQMKFEVTTNVQKQVCTTVKKKVKVPKDTKIVAFYDRTSMDTSSVENLRETLQEWFTSFKQTFNEGNNEIEFFDCERDWNYRWNSENWLKEPQEVTLNILGENKNVILLLFVDEFDNTIGATNTGFHTYTFRSPLEVPTDTYKISVNNFINNLYNRFESLVCINYPIVRYTPVCYEYLQHAIAAIEAKNMSLEEVNNLKKNPIIPDNIWNQIKINLQNNPYVGQPRLKDYNFLYKENRCTNVGQNTSENCPAIPGKVITPCMFTEDIQDLLGQLEEREIEEIECNFIDEIKMLYLYIPGTPTTTEGIINNSWTLSYSLKYNTWTSFHSYIPNFYFRMNDKHFSWLYGNNNIYKHNRDNHFQEFYGKKYPYIIEYVSNDNPIVTKIFDHIRFLTEAKRFDSNSKEYYDERFITFNKAILYNSRQCSGELNLRVKDITPEQEDYLKLQIINENNNVIFLDRNEKDWLLNDFRDYRIDYNKPIWNKDKNTISENNNSIFIDKVLNNDTIDLNKEWYDLESFRDKYLVVRLSFDNFANDLKLIFSFSSEDKTISNY